MATGDEDFWRPSSRGHTLQPTPSALVPSLGPSARSTPMTVVYTYSTYCTHGVQFCKQQQYRTEAPVPPCQCLAIDENSNCSLLSFSSAHTNCREPFHLECCSELAISAEPSVGSPALVPSKLLNAALKQSPIRSINAADSYVVVLHRLSCLIWY